MKILKTVLIVLAAIIAIWLIVAAFISGDCRYEKSISINAPAEKVWENVNSLKAMDQWSPWNEKDPNLKKTFTGIDGTVGAKQCWESTVEDLGNGCQTLSKIDHQNKRIDANLKFLTPYESEAKGYITVVPEAAGSKVTWGFTSEIPYPFSIMKLFMNLEDAVGKDYNSGLQKLKKISEQP
ncbi:MAG: SRPBCC family protein [Kaistella sp.]|nr:SRPBCC family protein [Kaistella sp.]